MSPVKMRLRENFSLSDAMQEEISKLISTDVEDVESVKIGDLLAGSILRIDSFSGNCYLFQMTNETTNSALVYRLARFGKFGRFGFLGPCSLFCIDSHKNELSEKIGVSCPMAIVLKDDILFTTFVQRISIINIL